MPGLPGLQTQPLVNPRVCAEGVKMSDQLLKQLLVDEGYRRFVYPCSEGFDTVGVGYNLEANPLKLPDDWIAEIRKHGISRVDACILCENVCDQLEKSLADNLNFWPNLSEPRRDVLINMAYNLGIPRLMQFKNTLSHMHFREYTKASKEMLNSKWAKQVGDRAVRLSRQMATGTYA
jgi:lysozyme